MPRVSETILDFVTFLEESLLKIESNSVPIKGSIIRLTVNNIKQSYIVQGHSYEYIGQEYASGEYVEERYVEYVTITVESYSTDEF